MFIGFGATFQPLTVESLSPHQQFVIALRSPAGVCETGRPITPSDKRVTKLALEVGGGS